MSFMMLRPLPISDIYTGTSRPGMPVANLLDPEPLTTWGLPHLPVEWATVIDVDFGTDVNLDTVALVNCNPSNSMSWSAHTRTAAQGPFPGTFDTAGANPLFGPDLLRVGGTPGIWTCNAVRSGPLRAARYLKVGFYTPAGDDPYFLIGCLLAGLKWSPEYGVGWGAGKRPVDLSDRQVTSAGGRAGELGPILTEWRGSFPWISDAELDLLWDHLRLIGVSRPVLVCEDDAQTAGLQRRIHYGTFQGADFFERTEIGKSRTEIRVLEWR